MIGVDAVATPVASLVARRVGEDTILVSARGDMLHTLNETGSFIWEHLDGERTLGDVLALMRQKYELPDSSAEAELCAFVDDLAQKGMVTVAS